MVEQLSLRPNHTKATLLAEFGPVLEFDRDLASLTTFKTGGAATYFIQADSAEALASAMKAACKLRIPFYIIGGGSNLLVSDSGFDGLIIRVSVSGLELVGTNEIACGAGEDLMSLVEFSAANALTGLEFSAGISGTVGGAIYGNAGAYGGEIKDIITELTLVDRQGQIKTVGPAYCRFGYRDSYLKITHEVVADARFRLEKGNAADVKNRIDEILATRAGKHPVDGKSAGSFFKNIPDKREKYGKLPAGRLLEEVGAKGMSVGGARVFEKHANMIVNNGKATSKDIRDLADILIKKVHDKFGITLEEEVIQIGKF